MGLDPHDHAQMQQQLDLLLQQQRDLIAGLERGQSHFQHLARSVWRVQEEERRRLARELHDGIGQNLTAIVHMIGQALTAISSSADPARAGLLKARDLAEATLAETRALSRQLRPQILDDLGLPAALRWLARTVADNHGLQIQLDLVEPLPQLSGDAATLIFRVVQEGLSNITRHAQARTAQISLHAEGLRAVLKLHDDGRGCDLSTVFAAGSEGQGSGVGGMRDRVRLFGGELRIDSAPGAGFTIAIEFPFAATTGKLAP